MQNNIRCGQRNSHRPQMHARVGFRQKRKKRREALAALMGLRIVLDVFRLIDHGDGFGIARFDVF